MVNKLNIISFVNNVMLGIIKNTGQQNLFIIYNLIKFCFEELSSVFKSLN